MYTFFELSLNTNIPRRKFEKQKKYEIRRKVLIR